MKSQVKFELFIGLLTNKGATVTPEQVQAFKALFAERLESLTLSYTTGVWKGAEEPALTLTHIGDIHELETIKELARIAKVEFKQDAVLIACTQVSTILIEETPTFHKTNMLMNYSKKELSQIAEAWGMSYPMRYKESEIRKFIEDQQYKNQGTRTGSIANGVGLK